MSRRPRRNRPPLLDEVRTPTVGHDAGAAPDAAEPRARVPTSRRRLIESRITGTHTRLSRDAVRAAIRALVNGEPRARLGCDGLEQCTTDEVRDALVATHGWDPSSSRASIEPDCTLAGARTAAEWIADAAGGGARVAIVTSRPASLLGLAQAVASFVVERGARLLTCDRASISRAHGRELWWVGGVAVVTDGSSILAVDGATGVEDWLFAVGRPDLVVADRAFAGAALQVGCRVVAWADLDAPALALATARGRTIQVVPVDEQRPAEAYLGLANVLREPHRPQFTA
jgi:hypothetical protein